MLKFYYGGKIISWEREVRRSTVPRLLIKVHPEGRVVAHDSLNASDAEVLAALKKRSRWIHEQLELQGAAKAISTLDDDINSKSSLIPRPSPASVSGVASSKSP